MQLLGLTRKSMSDQHKSHVISLHRDRISPSNTSVINEEHMRIFMMRFLAALISSDTSVINKEHTKIFMIYLLAALIS